MKYQTGVHLLDKALHGGIPPGICGITGGASSGKTSLGLSILREAEAMGMPTAIVHSDGMVDPVYFTGAGPSDSVVIIPTTGEAAFESVVRSIRMGVKVVLVDNMTNFYPRVGTIGDTLLDRNFYAQNKFLGRGLARLRLVVPRHKALVLVITQVRDRLTRGYGKPVSTSESTMALGCDTRLYLKRERVRNEYGELTYVVIGMKVAKLLGSPPLGEASGFIFNRTGFNRNFELLRALLDAGLFVQTGPWIRSHKGQLIGLGYVESTNWVKTNYDTCLEVLHAGNDTNDHRT